MGPNRQAAEGWRWQSVPGNGHCHRKRGRVGEGGRRPTIQRRIPTYARAPYLRLWQVRSTKSRDWIAATSARPWAHRSGSGRATEGWSRSDWPARATQSPWGRQRHLTVRGLVQRKKEARTVRASLRVKLTLYQWQHALPSQQADPSQQACTFGCTEACETAANPTAKNAAKRALASKRRDFFITNCGFCFKE